MTTPGNSSTATRRRPAGWHSAFASQSKRLRTAIVAAASIAFTAGAEAGASCFSATLGSFDPTTIIDGRSFRLTDGREVLLAGVEVPAGAGARAALERLLAGQKITLRQAGSVTDRYGRLIAHAFVQKDGAERWIQQELLAAGQAQVGVRAGDAACTKALLSAEAPARRDRLGLWADSSYSLKASDDLEGLLARQGRFTVAEGKILSVRESGATLYINFGRVWPRNLTVTILRRNRASFDSAGMDLKKLQGVRVRVRGTIEERGGPRMEATRPEQIEIAAQE